MHAHRKSILIGAVDGLSSCKDQELVSQFEKISACKVLTGHFNGDLEVILSAR